MSTKRLWSSALLWTCLAGSELLAQVPTLQPTVPAPSVVSHPVLTAGPSALPTPASSTPAYVVLPEVGEDETPPTPAISPTGLTTPLPPGAVSSPWINYPRGPFCCDFFGTNGPVHSDLYMRTGPSLVLSGGILADSLSAGWSVVGGGRTLFFNPAGDAAWALDLSLDYTYNRGGKTQPTFQLLTGEDVRLVGLSRTSFNLMLGRQWFAYGPAFPGAACDTNYCFGVDIGSRYGTQHADMESFNSANFPYRRRHSVFVGATVATHADMEIPFGGLIFVTGVRVEWNYNWSNMFRRDRLDSDLSTLNVHLSGGLRF